jgi:hypothetical protein
MGLDDDDVRAEARVRVWQALTRIRPRNLDPESEIKYGRTVIKHFLIDLSRKAAARARAAEGARGSILTDDSAMTASVSAHRDSGGERIEAKACRDSSPEAALMSRERQDVFDLALRHLRTKIEPARIHALEARVLQNAPLDPSLRPGTARQRLDRTRRTARRVLGVDTLEQAAGLSPQRRPMKAEALSLDHLLRTLLVHQQPAPIDLDREKVVAAVAAINLDAATGTEVEFPACFAKEFDATDSTCSDVCDFRVECQVCLGADEGPRSPHYHEKVEAQLTLIKRRAHRFAEPGPVTPKAAAAEAPSPTGRTVQSKPNPQVVKPGVVRPALVEVGKSITSTAHVEELVAAQIKLTAEKPKEKPPANVVKAEKAAKPEKKPKAARRIERSAEPVPIDLNVRPLSSRHAVFPKGQRGYRVREDGRRWVRKPQGSAAFLAQVPVGTWVEREWQGALYRARKKKDGKTVEMKDGRQRKRDGLWELLEVYTITAPGSRGKRLTKLEGFSGSLNQVAFHITGTNTWSGAKFFSVLPPELRPGHPKYDPSAFEAGTQSLYRFEGV